MASFKKLSGGREVGVCTPSRVSSAVFDGDADKLFWLLPALPSLPNTTAQTETEGAGAGLTRARRRARRCPSVRLLISRQLRRRGHLPPCARLFLA